MHVRANRYMEVCMMYGMAWHGMAWNDLVWSGMIWYGIVCVYVWV